MHYLIVSPISLFPDTSGNRCLLLSMVRQIKAAGHRVSFLFSKQEETTPDAVAAMHREVDAYYTCDYSVSTQSKAYSDLLIRMVLEKADFTYPLDAWYEENIGQMAQKIYAQDPFDVMLGNYIWMSKAFEAVPDSVVKIQQTHDRMTDRALSLAKQGLVPTWFSVTAADEARGLHRADINIALQRGEELYFRSLTDKPVFTVQQSVEDHPLRDITLPQGRKLRVGFLASNNSVNVGSLRNIVEELFKTPEVANRIELRVAGKICDIFASTPPFVTTLGCIENLEQFYADIDIIINPTIGGTGLKIKSVEALQRHVPIVMTLSGGEGLMSPFHFHNCITIKELLGYLKLIADDSRLLTLVQGAGEKVLHAYKYRLEKASRVLLRPHEILADLASRKASVIEVPSGHETLSFTQPASGYEHHFLDEASLAHICTIAPQQGVWLDIGCRSGEFALKVAKLSHAAKIIALEFDPTYIEQLSINVFANKAYDIVDMSLLGFVASDSPGYGFLDRTPSGETVAVLHDGDSVLENAVIPFIRLDQALATEKRIDVIHISLPDPFAALQGSATILNKFRPLIFFDNALAYKERLADWAKVNGYDTTILADGTSFVLLSSPNDQLSRHTAIAHA